MQSAVRAALLAAIVVVGSDLALAQDEKKSEEVKPEEKTGAAPPKEEPPVDQALRTTGPAVIKRVDALSQKKFDNSKRADAKRDEQIAEIKALLPKMKGKPQEGELVFRLAEIYWNRSKFIYEDEFKKFDTTYQKWVDEGRQGKEPTLADFTKQSEAYKKQALENYQIILDKHPDYPRLDEVLYILAYNQYEAGNTREAIDNYSQLIRQYPESEYVSDSYLALGEHYFKNNDLPKSTKAYTKAFDIAEKKKRAGTANFALYKLAWCDYNAQTYKDALSKFKEVIKRANTIKEKDTGIELKREALNDMVLTYSHLDETQEAYNYIKSEAGGSEAFRLSGKLAAIYKEQGKHALQIDTLRMLLNLDPDNTQAPDYQSNIVQAYEKMGDRNNVRKEVSRLVELYRPGSPWWRKNESNKANVERALAIAESRLRELVTEYHRFAQKHKKVEDYEVARDIYAQYLVAFPDSEQAYRLNFFYAELLWDLGQWREAAHQYDVVVKRNLQGEYAKVCAYNAVLAWEKIVNKIAPPAIKDGVITTCTPDEFAAGKCKQQRHQGDVGKDVKKVVLENYEKGKKYDPEPIPPDELSLANACDAYVAVMADDWKKDKKIEEELVVVKFKAGYIYQSHNHFDEAAKRFGELIEKWPGNEYARKGADQILDSYDARENYPALEQWSRTFAKNDVLMKDDKFAKLVARFMEGATFKNADATRIAYDKTREGKDKEATKAAALASIEKFDAFVKEFPKSEFAVLAVYNVGIQYANEEILDQAIVWSERLLNEYGKELVAHPELKKIDAEKSTYAALAAYYEKVAQYKTAADWYVKYADKYKDDAKSPDSIYNAGIFLLGLGDTEGAVKMFTRYIKDFPKQTDIPDVYLRMAAIYEDKEDWKRTAAMYGEFEKLHGTKAKPEQVLASRYKTALSLQKAGRDKDMLDVCNGIITNWSKLDEAARKSAIGVDAGGYCAFHLLEKEWLEYKAIKIEQKAGASGKKAMQLVGAALDLKKKKRDEIAKKYFDLKDYGSAEWAIAGLLRAADALLDYTNTLRSTPPPPALANNPEAIDIFISELENLAFPVEEQAIVALEAALDAAFQKGVYSPFTIEIEDRLRKFKPAKFGRIYELPFFPSAAESRGETLTTASR